MVVSDALIVGEEWISEHYFTTDATKQSFRAKVTERRKLWDEEKDQGTTRTRFTAQRGDLLTVFSTLEPDDARLPALYKQIESILGYDRIGLTHEEQGPITRINSQGLTGGAPLAIIHAKPVASVEDLLAKDANTLLEPYWVDDTTSLSSVARAISALFTATDHPEFILVLAGGLALVAERERWAEGRYLLVDLQLVAERNDDKKGGEVDRALAVLDAASLAPDAEGNIWWRDVLDNSVKHTVGVSSDLREGVRLSIEIIANDVVARRKAHGLDSLPAGQAQELARQSLRFLYRILFLLYAEASPELGVLPVGVPEYELGYSLDRLRDLTLVELTTANAANGTHLYDSLKVLFGLIDHGHDPTSNGDELHEGLTFRSLRADLFLPRATALIDEVKLGNEATQRVLRHLLLSKEKRGSDRGFISYAELGINQLGAVYEGLMSYTGFFAETDLYEVAKGGDASKGSWIVPVDRADGIAAEDFVKAEDEITGEMKPVLHRRGTFVFRLAGRERQQSASYYTPEVLTKFVVSQALEELLDQDGETTTALDILDMTVCEPALGSGAFAIEAVRQLAEQYLTRRQAERGERIDPDAYPRELQKVKAYLALHQTYGVDLNATAVELAEISLWLDTMVEGLNAPWFGLHLRRGNSLIGARRTVYSRHQVEKKAWLKEMPRDVPLTDMPVDISDGCEGSASGSIHHFLLPVDGWGSAIDAKEARALAPEGLAKLREWRKSVLGKPTKKQTDALVGLGRRVEILWQFVYQRLAIAEHEIRRSIEIWGADDLPVGGAVTREQIETSLADADGAYSRLRRVMDAWTAMWFWSLTEDISPPTLDEWIVGLQKILGLDAANPRKHAKGQLGFGSAAAWDELTDQVQNDLAFAGASKVEKALAEHPWLSVCERIALEQGFFHWELDFAPVFGSGGFDIQLGNPPWVRPRSDVDALLAEGDPWWQLAVKPTQTQIASKREQTLALPGIKELVLQGTADTSSTAGFLGDSAQYPHLVGLQPDLYRCFMEQTWRHAKSTGSVGLIHPESHFTDEKAGPLRAATYQRIRRHWQFWNELVLFEIDHHVSFGVHIYSSAGDPDFLQATSLYHPETVVRSLEHDGSGVEPGLKDPEGNWDLRPHASRILSVDTEVLETWRAVLEADAVPVDQSRMVYTVNRSTAAVLDKLSTVQRIGSLGLQFSRGWDESIDRKKGMFDSEWGVPESWDSVILQGPHLYVSTPFYKTPNPTMLHNQDWSPTDFEALASAAVPATAYKPRGSRARYDSSYTSWTVAGGGKVSARSFYRVAWRNMAANKNERTLIPALVPPGSAHIHTVYSFGAPDRPLTDLVVVAASLGSLLGDFGVRSAPKSSISWDTANRLPLPFGQVVAPIVLRALRLNCVTEAYAELWERCYDEQFASDDWLGGYEHKRREALGAIGPTWSAATPLRIAADRRQALVEIDALVALALGVSADELCTIYRTQFPVLYGYDQSTYVYDANGRLVPGEVLSRWRKKGSLDDVAERTAVHPGSGRDYTYELPFTLLDREAELRCAYGEFDSKLSLRSNSA